MRNPERLEKAAIGTQCQVQGTSLCVINHGLRYPQNKASWHFSWLFIGAR